MQRETKSIGSSVTMMIIIHIVGLLLTTIYRWLLYAGTSYDIPADIDLITRLTAFVKGVWFDNVIGCYIMIVPLVMMFVCSLFMTSKPWITRVVKIWFGFSYTLVFVISAANIPYFGYFFQNINSSIFLWFGYAGTTAGMVVGESSYWAPIAYGLIGIALFILFLVKLPSRWDITRLGRWQPGRLICIVYAILIGLCLFGIRGRMGYNPIKVSQAYYCNDPFLNQLGISPTFNLLTSYLDDQRKENRRLTLMDDDKAVAEVQRLLGRNGISGVSPIARQVTSTSSESQKRNVVIILMESMSASLMKSLDGNRQLTPFLDSLYTTSWVFTNMYSAGNHTNHGMYATLYSWPAIMFRNLMKGSVIPRYKGLPTVLKDNGYHNFFFMTHESQYDNMNGFFRTNGFDEIYAQENYPADKVVNSFGVQDDFLYSYAVPVLTKYNASHKDSPFFTVLLSISNHPPYIVPDTFKRTSKSDDDAIVEYADWSIRQFFEMAKKQPWYDNTIFVLLGDHGKLMKNPECELPESYNHIPLIIHGAGIVPHISSDFALQEDVAPTLLSLLGISYTQNDFGIDLSREQRDCVFYTGDKIVAARDHQRLYMYNPTEKTEMLFMVNGRNKVTKAKAMDQRFKYLKNYVFAMLQCAEKLR